VIDRSLLTETDGAEKFDAAESGFADLRWDHANVRLVASGTVAGERLVFACFSATDNFDLLHRGDGILGVGGHRAATARALFKSVPSQSSVGCPLSPLSTIMPN